MNYRWIAPIILMVAPMLAAQDDRGVQEEIQVTRMLVDVRVLDRKGDPLTDLTKADFELTSRGQTLEIISCNWIDDRVQTAREPGGEMIDLATTSEDDARFWAPIPPGGKQDLGGRIIVFVVQGIKGNGRYMSTLRRMDPHFRELINSLEPSDYVAVFSYDYKLKLHLDLTRAHPYLEQAYLDAVQCKDGIEFGDGKGRNFAELIDRYKVEDAVNVEKGMELIGKALERFAGSKTLVYMGYKMGRRIGSTGRFDKRPEYTRAVESFQKSSTAVFVLDMVSKTPGSAPSMLRQIAQDTGGFYRMAQRSLPSAFPKVLNAVKGHYQLVFRIPDQKKPRYRLKVNRKHEEILVRKPINEQDYTF